MGSTASFETALDVLGQLIGHGRQLAADPTTDPADVDMWSANVERWVEQHRELHPDDNDAITTVLDQDAPFLRSIIETSPDVATGYSPPSRRV